MRSASRHGAAGPTVALLSLRFPFQQYQDTIRAHKAGKMVDFSELPVPPGIFPVRFMASSSRSCFPKLVCCEEEDLDPSSPARWGSLWYHPAFPLCTPLGQASSLSRAWRRHPETKASLECWKLP